MLQAGVVDQYVDGAVGVHRRCDGSLQFLLGGDVAFHPEAVMALTLQFRRLFRQLLFIDIRKHHLGSVSQEVTADLMTDAAGRPRSEEHTSELQSRENLVCRLLLEKK